MRKIPRWFLWDMRVIYPDYGEPGTSCGVSSMIRDRNSGVRLESRSNPAERIQIRGTDDFAREKFVREKATIYINSEK
jgi:hypothetical protein